MSLDDEFESALLADTLLEPTRIYVKDFKKNRDNIVALAHITGGGIVENLPRVLPDGVQAVINRADIKILPVFEFMSQHVNQTEMYRTFNMGIGMIWIVENENVDAVLQNTDGYVIGHTKSGTKGVELI